MNTSIQPRLIRFVDAPAYCGMTERFFNLKIRPRIDVEIVDGTKFVAFDRLDLDHAIDEYKKCNGKPWKNKTKKTEETTCQNDHQGYNSTKKQKRGVSTKQSTVKGSGEIYDLALNEKRK